jgi:hypothetical protein
MEPITENLWLVPAILVAIFGLLLQGIKAGWDLWFSIRNNKISQETTAFQRLSTFLTFAEGLPLMDTEKTSLKLDLINATIKCYKADLLFHIRNSIQNKK